MRPLEHTAAEPRGLCPALGGGTEETARTVGQLAPMPDLPDRCRARGLPRRSAAPTRPARPAPCPHFAPAWRPKLSAPLTHRGNTRKRARFQRRCRHPRAPAFRTSRGREDDNVPLRSGRSRQRPGTGSRRRSVPWGVRTSSWRRPPPSAGAGPRSSSSARASTMSGKVKPSVKDA